MDINTNSQNPENQNSNNLVIPQPPAIQPAVVRGSRSRKIIFYIVILVLILAILGGAVYGYRQNKKTAQTQTNIKQPAVTVPAGPSIANNRAMLLPLSKITFPKITETKDASFTSLPDVLQKLIGAYGKTAKVEQITYQNGQSGNTATYQEQVSPPLLSNQTIAFLANQPNIKMLYASYATYFGIVEFRQNNDTVRVTITANTETENSSSTIFTQSIYEK